MSNVWQVREANARFSEMLEMSLTEGPQVVTKGNYTAKSPNSPLSNYTSTP